MGGGFVLGGPPVNTGDIDEHYTVSVETFRRVR